MSVKGQDHDCNWFTIYKEKGTIKRDVIASTQCFNRYSSIFLSLEEEVVRASQKRAVQSIGSSSRIGQVDVIQTSSSFHLLKFLWRFLNVSLPRRQPWSPNLKFISHPVSINTAFPLFSYVTHNITTLLHFLNHDHVDSLHWYIHDIGTGTLQRLLCISICFFIRPTILLQFPSSSTTSTR